MDFKEVENNLYVTSLTGKNEEIVHFEEIGFDNMNCIRIYPSNDPEIFNFQLRAKQSLKGKQKERNIVATVKFKAEDLQRMVDFMKENCAVKS
ncbi:hypothetical protein [Flexithrix dorotheae]|uniref:hypothetical protein n=1 Tax=Flexithrix dorotheae TaxID=70993 RepID=UPI000377AEAF|nr:hypothetical protein [Flexithrix dorotheae]